MTTHFKVSATGTFYRFDHAGDGIAMHAHAQRELWHLTSCLKGGVAIYGDSIDIRLRQGDVGRFPSFRQHEIVALEDGSEIINLLTHPAPDHRTDYDAPGMSGSVEVVLMGRTEFPL